MDDIRGFMRVILPRYTAKGQREAMLAHNVKHVIQTGQAVRDADVPEGMRIHNGTRDDLMTWARKGTLIAIQHAHLLAEPALRGKRGGTRRDFWDALDALEEKGAVIWELYTGLRTSNRQQRDRMIRDAIDTLARGRHKTRMSDKRGRPPKEFTEAQWAQAERAWESRRLKTWADVAAKLPKGMTVRRAWQMFGPRNVETTEET